MYFFFAFIRVCAISVWSAWGGQKRAFNPVEQELQMALTAKWVPGIILDSGERAASTFSSAKPSPQALKCFSKIQTLAKYKDFWSPYLRHNQYTIKLHILKYISFIKFWCTCNLTKLPLWRHLFLWNFPSVTEDSHTSLFLPTSPRQLSASSIVESWHFLNLGIGRSNFLCMSLFTQSNSLRFTYVIICLGPFVAECHSTGHE